MNLPENSNESITTEGLEIKSNSINNNLSIRNITNNNNNDNDIPNSESFTNTNYGIESKENIYNNNNFKNSISPLNDFSSNSLLYSKYPTSLSTLEENRADIQKHCYNPISPISKKNSISQPTLNDTSSYPQQKSPLIQKNNGTFQSFMPIISRQVRPIKTSKTYIGYQNKFTIWSSEVYPDEPYHAFVSPEKVFSYLIDIQRYGTEYVLPSTRPAEPLALDELKKHHRVASYSTYNGIVSALNDLFLQQLDANENVPENKPRTGEVAKFLNDIARSTGYYKRKQSNSTSTSPSLPLIKDNNLYSTSFNSRNNALKISLPSNSSPVSSHSSNANHISSSGASYFSPSLISSSSSSSSSSSFSSSSSSLTSNSTISASPLPFNYSSLNSVPVYNLIGLERIINTSLSVNSNTRTPAALLLQHNLLMSSESIREIELSDLFFPSLEELTSFNTLSGIMSRASGPVCLFLMSNYKYHPRNNSSDNTKTSLGNANDKDQYPLSSNHSNTEAPLSSFKFSSPSTGNLQSPSLNSMNNLPNPSSTDKSSQAYLKSPILITNPNQNIFSSTPSINEAQKSSYVTSTKINENVKNRNKEVREIHFNCIMRHQNPLLCTIGLLALYMYDHFQAISMPSFASLKSWYFDKLFTVDNKYRTSPYSIAYNRELRRLLSASRVQSTALVRDSAAKYCLESGISPSMISKYYLVDLIYKQPGFKSSFNAQSFQELSNSVHKFSPLPVVRVQAGLPILKHDPPTPDDAGGLVCVSRAQLIPPESLQRKIFPSINKWVDAIDLIAKDGGESLRSLMKPEMAILNEMNNYLSEENGALVIDDLAERTRKEKELSEEQTISFNCKRQHEENQALYSHKSTFNELGIANNRSTDNANQDKVNMNSEPKRQKLNCVSHNEEKVIGKPDVSIENKKTNNMDINYTQRNNDISENQNNVTFEEGTGLIIENSEVKNEVTLESETKNNRNQAKETPDSKVNYNHEDYLNTISDPHSQTSKISNTNMSNKSRPPKQDFIQSIINHSSCSPSLLSFSNSNKEIEPCVILPGAESHDKRIWSNYIKKTVDVINFFKNMRIILLQDAFVFKELIPSLFDNHVFNSTEYLEFMADQKQIIKDHCHAMYTASCSNTTTEVIPFSLLPDNKLAGNSQKQQNFYDKSYTAHSASTHDPSLTPVAANLISAHSLTQSQTKNDKQEIQANSVEKYTPSPSEIQNQDQIFNENTVLKTSCKEVNFNQHTQMESIHNPELSSSSCAAEFKNESATDLSSELLRLPIPQSSQIIDSSSSPELFQRVGSNENYQKLQNVISSHPILHSQVRDTTVSPSEEKNDSGNNEITNENDNSDGTADMQDNDDSLCINSDGQSALFSTKDTQLSQESNSFNPSLNNLEIKVNDVLNTTKDYINTSNENKSVNGSMENRSKYSTTDVGVKELNMKCDSIFESSMRQIQQAIYANTRYIDASIEKFKNELLSKVSNSILSMQSHIKSQLENQLQIQKQLEMQNQKLRNQQEHYFRVYNSNKDLNNAQVNLYTSHNSSNHDTAYLQNSQTAMLNCENTETDNKKMKDNSSNDGENEDLLAENGGIDGKIEGSEVYSQIIAQALNDMQLHSVEQLCGLLTNQSKTLLFNILSGQKTNLNSHSDTKLNSFNSPEVQGSSQSLHHLPLSTQTSNSSFFFYPDSFQFSNASIDTMNSNSLEK